MNFFIVLTAVLPLVAHFETQASENTYVGAVVEYSPVFNSNERVMVLENVKNYELLTVKAKSKGADIVVFPEGGLNAKFTLTEVPHPSEGICPCDSNKYNEVLTRLSCAAKNNYIYSVVNLPEKRVCSPDEDGCPERGFFQYNTNVAFDRRGVVVARYAKYNLYDEIDTDKPEAVENSFFETDFGVTFGTFICFDILFAEPALRMIEQYGITDFVMTTAWFSELPFLTAIQTQKGWAESNDVNLLSAGYNLPKIGSSGSGIYNGRFGALVAVMPEVNTSRVLVATVPKKRRQNISLGSLIEHNSTTSVGKAVSYKALENEIPHFELKGDQMFLFSSAVIDNDKDFVQTICTESKFCCNFRVSTTKLNRTNTNYHYRAMVMDGVRMFGRSASGGVQSCGVVLCDGPRVQNCSSRVPNISKVIKVNEIEITGKQFERRNSFHMASTLTDNKKLEPLPSHKYLFRIKDEEMTREVTMQLLWPVADLKTFAIWGRVFKRDGEPIIVSSAPSLSTVSWLLLLLLSSSVIFGHSLPSSV